MLNATIDNNTIDWACDVLHGCSDEFINRVINQFNDEEDLNHEIEDIENILSNHNLKPTDFREIYAEIGQFNIGTSIADKVEKALEDCIGRYESMAHYAEEMTNDCADIPTYVKNYINWEAMGDDMRHDCTTVETDNGVWIFG